MTSRNEQRRSFFSFITQPTRRIYQRLSFHNRWRQKGVKFDPKFHFIIGQLIIKDIVQTSGVIDPDTNISSTRRNKKNKRDKNEIVSSNNNTKAMVPKSATTTSIISINHNRYDNHSQVISPPSPTSVFDLDSKSQSLMESFLQNTAQEEVGKEGKQEKIESPSSSSLVKNENYSQRCLDCTENCPICWDIYKVGEKVCFSKNVECSHAFHFDCMVTWLVDNDHCPLCRSPYLINKPNEKKKRNTTNNAGRSTNRRRPTRTHGASSNSRRTPTTVRRTTTTSSSANNRNIRTTRVTRRG